MNIRLLNQGDTAQMQALLGGQKTYFGLDIDKFPVNLSTDQAMIVFTHFYLRVSNDYFKCYGAFDDDGKLVGSIGADFMQDQPFWILRRICVDENFKGQGQDVIQQLMTAVLEFAESKGYYQHIYLIPEKYKRAHSKIWSKNELRKDRYDVYELDRVPANGITRFRLYWELLYGRYRYPLDTVVRMSVLKEEFR